MLFTTHPSLMDTHIYVVVTFVLSDTSALPMYWCCILTILMLPYDMFAPACLATLDLQQSSGKTDCVGSAKGMYVALII